MLSEHGEQFVCILAGYKTEIHRDILAINPGMERRFNTRFDLGEYTPADIRDILLLQLRRRGVTLEGALPPGWVRAHHKAFTDMGGSCLTLTDDILRCHARRLFGAPAADKNRVTQADLDAGLALFLHKHDERTAHTRIPESVRMLYN